MVGSPSSNPSKIKTIQVTPLAECLQTDCTGLHVLALLKSTVHMQDLRKGNVRKFWEWGRCSYRCIAFSYGAFSVYENPWLVRAVVTALWTAGKVMLGMLL